MSDLIKFEQLSGDMEQVQKRLFDIPFGNSAFQIDSIVAGEKTPERAYRALLLNYTQRYKDLEHGSICREQSQNKVKMLKNKIAKLKAKISEFDSVKGALEIEELNLTIIDTELEIKKIVSGWEFENKLSTDCVQELKHMMNMIAKMPEYNRQDFEQAEEKHFDKSLPVNNQLPQLIRDGGLLKEITCKPVDHIPGSDVNISVS